MTGVRILGMAMVLVGATAVGLLAAQGLKRRVRELELACAVLDAMGSEFSYSLSPPDQVAERLSRRESFAPAAYLGGCVRLCKAGLPFPAAWRQAVNEQEGMLTTEDKKILAALSDTLGQSDLDGQAAALRHTKELLEVQLQAAREESAGRGKLYRTLGLLGGVFFLILGC